MYKLISAFSFILLEIRLLTNGRRVATIMAVTICSLYSLDVDDFKLGIGILVTSSDFSDFWGGIIGRKPFAERYQP